MKKGFTLIELLCVIIIIAVVSVIVFPIVTGNINRSKEELMKVQIKDIESAAKKWALDNLDELDKFHINDIYLSIVYMQDVGYLEKDTILNPSTKEEMDGCVLVKYNEELKQYDYKYQDIDCSTDNYKPQDSDAYIIYVDGLSINKSNKKSPFYQYILEHDELKVDGEEVSGLYSLENEYVFRGKSDEIRNYVEYAGHIFRILSISKNDNTMKLLSTDGMAGMWSSIKETDYSKLEIFDNFDLHGNIVSDKWYNGVIKDVTSLRDVRSSLINKEINKNIGLISLYDYLIASLNCSDNIFDSSCSTNNYLKEIFNGNNVWTMNTDSEKIWYITNTGSIDKFEPDGATYYLYPVITLPVNVYVINDEATGSKDSPYKIKSNIKLEDEE